MLFLQESTSSKKAKTEAEGDEAEGSDKNKSEVEDDDEQDGNDEVHKIRAAQFSSDGTRVLSLTSAWSVPCRMKMRSK